MNNKLELSLDMIKTLLKLYENQEKLSITAIIKNKETNKKYFYKNGDISGK